MTIKRLEAIHNLLFQGKDITEGAILDMYNSGGAITMPEFLTDNFVSDISKKIGIPTAECNDIADAEASRLLELKSYVERQLDILNRKIYLDVIPAIGSLWVSNKDTLGMINNIALMPYDDIWSAESTASITNDSIINSTKNGNSFISINDTIDVTTTVSDIGGSYNAITSLNDKNINIKYLSKYNSPKRIVALIDRNSNESFNVININPSKAIILSIQTSEDGMEFSGTSIKSKKTIGGVMPLDVTSSRYVRLIFDVDKSTNYRNGMYEFEINAYFDMGILGSENDLFFSTKTIDVGMDGTALSISDDSNANIRYEVSINESPYRVLSALENGSGVYDKYLNINDFSSNKLISLKDFTFDGQNYNSQLEIPAEFISSNSLRVFDNNETWRKTKFGYVGNFIAYSKRSISIGSKRVIINGAIKTGDILLSPGIYKIEIFKENCLELFNELNISEDNGYVGYNRVIVDKMGLQRSIQDDLYPYNHLYLIKDAFDYSLGIDLIENIDYSIYNNSSSYYLSLANKSREIIISYMLSQSNIDTIKIKGVFEDSTTLSSLSKILVNIS